MRTAERWVIGMSGLVGLVVLLSVLWGPRAKQSPPPDERVGDPPELWPVAGSLSGLTVYLSPGHGRYLQHSRVRDQVLTWDFQREPANGLTEDLWTVELARYVRDELVERGASVVALRELDKASGVVVDDESPAAVLSGMGRRVDGVGLVGGSGTWLERGAAVYTVEPAPVERSLYFKWCAHPRAGLAEVGVEEGGTRRRVVVDQRHHAGVWWYLGPASAGSSVRVDVQGDGLCVDAVRAGGELFRPALPRSEPSPMWQVAASHYLSPLPEAVARDDRGRPVSDARFRPLWVAAVAPTDVPAVYLSLHSDAGKGRGTSTFVGEELEPPLAPLERSVALAHAIHPGVVAAARKYDETWKDRGAGRMDLSEVSPRLNPLPAVLIEVGYHDHPRDAELLIQNAFQRDVAAAIAEGLAHWHAQEPR